MTKDSIRIIEPANQQDLDATRQLFDEYAQSLPFNLSFQNFEKEHAELPGKYSRPQGCLLLALHEDAYAGCVAMREIGDGICEMKRLFVRPEFTGLRIGYHLVEAIVEAGRAAKYRAMRLDTIDTMVPAISLYRKFGFVEIAQYCDNPISGAVFMELIFSTDS